MENNTKLSIATKPGEPVILQSAAETPRHPYLAEPYTYKRRLTREVMVGKVGVGGTNPIRVQSMTTTRTQDVEATLAQTLRLVEAGCEIVRITTPTSQDARALGEVKRRGVDDRGVVGPPAGLAGRYSVPGRSGRCFCSSCDE